MKDKYKCLYEIIGRIEDVATFLVPIGDLPKREWVGLTDEELPVLAQDSEKVMSLEQTRSFYKRIEAKLKEKNT